MTREEEIKERVETCGVYYVYDGRVVGTGEADDDMPYLIARNEELRRRVEKMQAVVDAARGLKLKVLQKRKPQDYVHTFADCDKTNAVVMALLALDSKEQDDD